ncbi:MAG: MATE family efflux transporter [Muribaculaceae bacterium]
MKPIDREILRIALPAVVANITVPLLGLIDMSIAGHLGDAAFIGAMSVGATMFNLVYWNFGFLRMGTSGLTAQAYGRGDTAGAVSVLMRACALATAIALAIIVLQYPLQWLALRVISPSSEVLHLAQRYFFVVVWGAPAILAMMAIKGWFLGMQDSQSAMRISICVDVVNVIASLVAVFVLRMEFMGIATGTLVAEYVAFAYSVHLLYKKHGTALRATSIARALRGGNMRGFMSVNADIFVRSFCLMLVTLAFISVGARSGNLTLAVNSLIMQLFILFSYSMDGIAFAGEALAGRYEGANDREQLRRTVKRLFVWGAAVMAVYCIAYGGLPEVIFSLLTSDADVVSAAVSYRLWCVAIPLASMAAFVWDGVFIGQTRTRGMLLTIVWASATFFVICFVSPYPEGNYRLWTAFIAYLAMRSAVQTWLYLRRR